MKIESRLKAGKILERVVFGILIVISIAVMATVVWINIKEWMN